MSFLYGVAEKLLIFDVYMFYGGVQSFQHHFGLLLLPKVILAQELLDLAVLREFRLGRGPLIFVLGVLVIIPFARLGLDVQLLHIFKVLSGLDADSHRRLIRLRIVNNLDKWKLFLNLSGLFFVVKYIRITVLLFTDIRCFICLNVHHLRSFCLGFGFTLFCGYVQLFVCIILIMS